jgi:hypothetical protein
MKDPIVSEAMSKLVKRRNKKYGKKWLSENARKAAAARHRNGK